MARERIPASEAISRICRSLEYSRAHVAKAMRDNRRMLDAKRNRKGRWTIPHTSEVQLKELVRNQSGRRYKLGETGPHVG